MPPYKDVIVDPAQAPDVIFAKERSPATNNDPPIPTPPETIKAPVEELVEAVDAVTEIPDELSIFVEALNESVLLLDNATPEAEPIKGVNIIGWLEFPVEATTFTFSAVVAEPELAPQVIPVPPLVTCNV